MWQVVIDISQNLTILWLAYKHFKLKDSFYEFVRLQIKCNESIAVAVGIFSEEELKNKQSPFAKA